MMCVLALDTALAGCSVAFYDGEKFFTEAADMDRGQAEHLVPMIGRVLAKAGADYADIENIVTTVGPGAFTGLRIGLSTARALGLALDVPVTGVSTLNVIARKFVAENDVATDEVLCVLLETRRADFYVQFGEGTPPEALQADEIVERLGTDGQVVFVGDAVARFKEVVTPLPAWRFVEGYALPDPCFMAQMAAAGRADLPPEPLYLRDADVSAPKKGRKILLEATDL